MKRIIALSAIASLALGLSACEDSDLIACTDDARSSVSLDLLDEDGAPIAGAQVQYSVDGEDPVNCEEFDAAYVCGWEVAGELLITARAEGFEQGEISVTVDEDECHIIPESAELVLSQSPVP